MTSLRGSPLLERESDLRQASGLLTAAARGDGSALVVEGPAGIGKSALLREVRARADAEGFTVLVARGAELERGFSFGVVRQLFEVHVRSAPEAERERILTGAAHLAQPAIGELDLTSASGPVPGSTSPSLDASFAVLHGLYWLTSNIAEAGPLLLAVDDAHWADVESLRFLAYLAGRLEGLPVMVAIAARRFEPGSPVELLEAVDSESASRVLGLAPLTEAATDEHVRALLDVEPANGFSSACHRVTGGNPQLIRELLAALAADGIEPTASAADRVVELHADRIAASILARVGRVGEPAVALARAVAVLGREATLELTTELVGLDPDEAASAVDALIALEILSPGEVLGFVHPIVRTAVYNDFAASDHGRLHWQGGSPSERARREPRLRRRPGGRDAAVGRPVGRGAPARGGSGGAGQRGAGRGASATSSGRSRRSPPDATRSELLFGLGRASSMLGDQRTAIKRLREALELHGRHAKQGRDRARPVQRALGFPRGRASDRAARRELAALPDDEHDLGVLLESDVDSSGFLSLPAKRAAEHHHRRFDDPQDPGMQATAAMHAALYGGPADQAAEHAIRAIGAGRLLEERGPDSPAVWIAGFALLYAHRLAEAVAFADAWMRRGEPARLVARLLAWRRRCAPGPRTGSAIWPRPRATRAPWSRGCRRRSGSAAGSSPRSCSSRAGWRRPRRRWRRPSAPRSRSSGRSSCRRC